MGRRFYATVEPVVGKYGGFPASNFCITCQNAITEPVTPGKTVLQWPLSPQLAEVKLCYRQVKDVFLSCKSANLTVILLVFGQRPR